MCVYSYDGYPHFTCSSAPLTVSCPPLFRARFTSFQTQPSIATSCLTHTRPIPRTRTHTKTWGKAKAELLHPFQLQKLNLIQTLLRGSWVCSPRLNVKLFNQVNDLTGNTDAKNISLLDQLVVTTVLSRLAAEQGSNAGRIQENRIQFGFIQWLGCNHEEARHLALGAAVQLDK